MSLLRGEAVAWLGRLAEPVLAGCAALWLGSVTLRMGVAGEVFAVLPAIGAALAGTWCVVSGVRVAIAWRRTAEDDPGPGVVTVEEGRIGYYGPYGGGFIRLTDLACIDLLDPAGPGQRNWRFTDEDGNELTIPENARGAEALPDALDHVPGLTYQTLATALLTRRAGVRRVWQKERSRLS